MTSTRVTMASVLPAGTDVIDDMTAEMAVMNATAVSLSRTEHLKNTLSFVFKFLEGARCSSVVRAFAHLSFKFVISYYGVSNNLSF